MIMQETCCTTGDMQAVGLYWSPPWHFHAHYWKFLPIATLFCDLVQFLHTHMAASQRWMSAADLCFFHKKLMVRSIFVHDIHLPLSMIVPTDWCNCRARKKPVPSSWVNDQLPLPHDTHNFEMTRCLCWNVINNECQSFMNSPYSAYKYVANYGVVFLCWLTSMWN